MIRFPSISLTAPQLPVREEHREKFRVKPADRLSLGAEVRESAHTDNSGFLKALAKNFRLEKKKKKRELTDPPGLKSLLEKRRDIKRSDLLGRDSQPLTRWTAEHFALLADNPLLRPADLKDVDNQQLQVIRARPELHPQELPLMDRQISSVLGPLMGQRGASHYMPLIRDNCFELLIKRGDLRPEMIVDLMRKMALAVGGVGSKGEGPDMFLKATETMVRRPDLTPEQLARVAQEMRDRVFYDGPAGQTQEAFGHSMDLLQKKNGLDTERISEQMQDMDQEPARQAGPQRRARVLHKRLRRLDAA
ncbi:MAG: hypothetical protein KF760_07965 [Candidatus Eremiobacteraeota bacterium]|nr:hypothetical protein [Candidatus Eremiobacteraeota bacterium]MCW5867997.1 hypothetical protein [Candidatus Eremiobacteraeota bacterium]